MSGASPATDESNVNANGESQTAENAGNTENGQEEPRTCKEKCKDCLCWDILCESFDEDDWEDEPNPKKKSTRRARAPKQEKMDRDAGASK